ncbi:DUF969 domain-containing protein [Burkholderia sp. Ac-20353]|uniref:DUF969 domain-containing protein n=1 Tax=Burkholderia sp. Ac-20353 TaxID=2703894 RepID=UPI00197BBFBA|nr:DUF969 domain-containing protein [Burkholderia sp. Ac-20353]MBN3786857.1 DUF969 domain-containing protein [Burkholderia sp. Ac-20353]
MNTINFWPLLGIGVIVLGFAIRLNPMLIVLVSALTTALLAGLSVDRILTLLGTGFCNTRSLPLIVLLPLAVIGMLERHGLREQAERWIARFRRATVARLLTTYLAVRGVSAALGLVGLGGHAQMVRPLLSPMVESTAQRHHGTLERSAMQRIKAMCAATDNIGLMFGEDIFVAFGAILLMVTFLRQAGIDVIPAHVAAWSMPTALCAFVIHTIRLRHFERSLQASVASTTRSAGTPMTIDAPRSDAIAPGESR